MKNDTYTYTGQFNLLKFYIIIVILILLYNIIIRYITIKV